MVHAASRVRAAKAIFVVSFSGFRSTVPTKMGYDLALFVERVDDNFLCAICHQCVKDAVTGCSHGHAFCAGCLATWRQHGTTCPMCCVDISHVQPTPCLPL